MVNSLVLVVVLAILVAARQQSTSSTGEVRQIAASVTASNEISNPLDKLSSADIALQVARAARLSEETAVVNQADSLHAQLSIIPTSNQVVEKPQIVATNVKTNKDIIKYVTVDGDTVSSLAAKFGVTSDSIKWSNALSGDAIGTGKALYIPPRNGIVYTVKAGDTADTLASKYKANKDQIIIFNDAEVTGLKEGMVILIPDGSIEAPKVTRSASYSGTFGASYSGNGYDYGYCTWWAAKRRIDIGRPLPSNLGNAITWRVLAERAGIPTGTVPQAGAVIWYKHPATWLGHVSFVERVNDDGSFVSSGMNEPIWGGVSTRTFSAADADQFVFIY